MNKKKDITFQGKNGAGSFHKFSLEVPDPTLPKIHEVKGQNFVSYGVDNLYPNNLITPLYNGSAMNRSCIQSKLIAILGEGLRTADPEMEYVLNRINPHEGWNEVFEKAAQDYLIYGGYALNVIWNEMGDKIIDIYHMDFNDVRSGHIDFDTNRVEWYYYSADWTKFKKDIYKPRGYKSFSPAHADLYPNQILYFFKHSPGQKYYPVPQYSGSLTDIQVDVSISSFHYFNLMNGLNPSLFIQMHNGIPGPEERQDVYQELASTFSGVDGTGRFFLSFADDKEHNVEITPIESANDDYYITLESRITSRILTGHRISSPLLLGIKDIGSAGLTNNKDEIVVAYTHFISTVIQPDQQVLLKTWDSLLSYYGYNTTLYLEPKRLFNSDGEQVGETVTEAIE
jgi:hypothetical protein